MTSLSRDTSSRIVARCAELAAESEGATKRLDDHEGRIRALERVRWKAEGARLLLAALASAAGAAVGAQLF